MTLWSSTLNATKVVMASIHISCPPRCGATHSSCLTSIFWIPTVMLWHAYCSPFQKGWTGSSEDGRDKRENICFLCLGLYSLHLTLLSGTMMNVQTLVCVTWKASKWLGCQEHYYPREREIKAQKLVCLFSYPLGLSQFDLEIRRNLQEETLCCKVYEYWTPPPPPQHWEKCV